MSDIDLMLQDIHTEVKKLRAEQSKLRSLVRSLAVLLRCNTKWLTAEDAAMMLGYERNRLTKMVRHGDIEGYRPTRKKTLIRRESLEEWITKQAEQYDDRRVQQAEEGGEHEDNS